MRSVAWLLWPDCLFFSLTSSHTHITTEAHTRQNHISWKNFWISHFCWNFFKSLLARLKRHGSLVGKWAFNTVVKVFTAIVECLPKRIARTNMISSNDSQRSITNQASSTHLRFEEGKSMENWNKNCKIHNSKAKQRKEILTT